MTSRVAGWFSRSGLVAVLGAVSAPYAVAQVCPAPGDVEIDFLSSQSYCELCGVGTVTTRVYYYDGNPGPGDPPITDIVITENMSAPDLVPVPGTTVVDARFGPDPAAPTPSFVGGQWQWDFGAFELDPAGNNPGNGQYLEITFQVRRANSATEEGLFGASKQIQSSVAYSATVGGPVCATDSTTDTLDFRAPDPSFIKQGRNADASQTGWSDPVYGHNNDDIIWRIQVQNSGDAALQDLRLDDLMASGNLAINYACPTNADAQAVADNNGVAPGGSQCIAASNTFADFVVTNPYGSAAVTAYGTAGSSGGGFTRNLNGLDVDVGANSTTAVLYLVGKVTANGSCISGGRTNTVSDLEFGCEADASGPGGISIVDSDVATLTTYHGDEDAQLTVTRSFTGVNTVGTTTVSNRPVGARGLMTITIENDTGGTVTDIVLDDVLPEQYVVDPTFWSGGFTQVLPVRGTPIAGESSIDPAYGAYPGMIDRITWENPPAGLTPPSQTPLQATAPRLRLSSSAAHPGYPEQIDMLRHGDIVTVTVPIVLISQDRGLVEPYDLVADLDVFPEVTGDGTDPAFTALLSNQLTVDYDTFCPTQGPSSNGHFTLNLPNNNINANPEDVDVQITDTSNNPGPVFILTNDPNQPLPLRVRVTNNGGHDAAQDSYHAFVSFGATMEVVGAPAFCSLASPLGGSPPQPDPWKTWVLPEAIPATATVYDCTPPNLAPGQTRNLDFSVVKTTDAARIALDDLTFRADVVGEILLHDGTPLWFPTPIARPDGETDRANNYTLDGIRQRVIGFNLIKTRLACNENDPAAFEPGPNTKDSERVEIGEECSYHVESGGWFGFQTPGFVLIAVQDVELMDNLPAGQGYVSSTDPNPTSTAQIQGITLMGSPVPPTPEGLDGLFTPGSPFSWRFNETQQITQLDEWFRADVTTRVLNNPIDLRAVPNLHAELSTNVLVSEFTAIFEAVGGGQISPRLGPTTVGYPNEPIRREDLTITEPYLELVKEVCNETRYGTGPACTNWTTLADDGDAYNDYIYRITVTNRAADDGIARSPAYDVVVTDTLDPSGFACVMPFASDGLDNDADGSADEGETDEGTLTGAAMGDCTSGRNGTVTFRHEHSTGLLRIDPGSSVELYYRVDYDDDSAPLQTFTNSVTASYDSLAGSTNESGNQTIDPRPNSDIGGARVYTSDPIGAQVRIIPVETPPKLILRTSNTPTTAPPGPQQVVIGEEIEYELTTLLPVALLRTFVIRDELPPGLMCAEAPEIDLDDAPYSDAGFQPGGIIVPTCSGDFVEWNFGNQRITQGTTPDNRYPFRIQFIARVENGALTNEGDVLSNGDPATSATASYIDEANNPVELAYGQVDVVVREPVITLEKLFSVAEADATDTVTVTINATNNGVVAAYNLQVLDDLTGTQLGYVGNVAGDDPPVTVDTTTYGADAPLFSWDPGFAIAPGDTVSFTFDVQLADDVETLDVLTNTAQAAWTSLPGQDTALNSTGLIGPDGDAAGMRNGALPNAGNPVNDYEAETSADITVRAPTLNKTDVDPALAPEIGAHKPFQVDIYLAEGVSNGVAATDNLDTGGVSYVLADNADFDVTYQFSGIATINGRPPDVGAFNAVPLDGTSGAATWDIGAVVTETEDDSTVNAIEPRISIYYYARINNDLVTDAGDPLQNSVDLTFLNGATGATETLTATTPPIAAIEPNLTATKVLTNVTPGKAPTDPLALNDIAQYIVTIDNLGTAIAHDINIVDTLPLELALYGGFTPTAAINGTPVAGFVAVPAGAPDGPLVWGSGNGDESLDLPPAAFLELTYQVVMRALADPGTTVDNNVWTDWTSLAGPSVYQRTGVGCPAWAAPNDYCFGPAVAVGDPVNVLPPAALEKANTQAVASIGEVFSYRITVPSVPYTAPLYDVRITDDLAASAADLTFVGVTKVAGSGAWTPVNTGGPTSLVIEDPVNGIDIPAGEQIVVDITVVVDDTPTNVDGLLFTNTATYDFNRLDGNPASARPGYPDVSEPMTIVEPVVTLEKSGPAQMRIGLPGTFMLDVHNPTLARAWGLTITDLLPETADTGIGGMCDAGASAITVQVFEADGMTPVSGVLSEGIDYAASFDPAPVCLLTLQMLSAAATVGPDQRLIVTYQASLDTDSEQDATLTNIAGATQWYSGDAAGPYPVRAYNRVVTDGTIGTLDHEDAYTVTVNLPVLRFEKTVANLSTGESPAATATPGELLRYSLRVENLSNVAVTGFQIVDELDRLNATASFQPGTLNVVTLPPGADASSTNPTGGAAGTGLLDIRNLDIGGLGETVLIEFEVVLAPVIADGSFVYNQSQLYTGGFPLAQSDDPNVNGQADPGILDDDDPTQLLIESAPYFDVDKLSAYITGDPNVLLAGETLRYTIRVANIGTDNAFDAMLRDNVPANTTYVAGSTTLNGVAVPDPTPGVSPLITGIALNAPVNATPGYLPADASASPNNVATVVFDVVVDPNLLDGTVLSNQGFVSAPTGGVLDRPSDDPRTPIPDDPTRDVVGNLPLLFAPKTAMLQIDLDNPGVVDPGDTLRYTITIYNNGAVPATEAVLMDQVPLNTTYVAGSTTLNGIPVPDAVPGESPLIGGIPVSSSDLTPPLPGIGEGTLTAGQAAVVQFDLLVDAMVPTGTLIINQATVATYELPDVLTDGDGNPATGPEPTVVVVGAGQQLAISKQVAVVGGGPAIAGATLEYVVRVLNIGAVPASYVEITDDLDMVTPNYLSYVPGSATMNGSTDGVTFVDPVITADYASTYGDLAPGGEIVLRFQAVIDPTLAIGTIVTNNGVVKWNDPPMYAEASVSIAVGGIPGIGILNGTAWHDADFDNVLDPTERLLEGWTVDLYRNAERVFTTFTAPDGTYRFVGVPPNYLTMDEYELRFVAPGAGPSTALLGLADSEFTNYLQRIGEIVVQSGGNLLNLNMPIDPNGVVYNSVTRNPLAGAVLTLVEAGSAAAVPASCFDDPAQQDQVTRADGYYKFDLNFAGAGCPSGGSYLIQVASPAGAYVAGYSEIMPPTAGPGDAPLSVPTCPATPQDAIPATAQYCEAQPSALAPPASLAARAPGTEYYVHLTLDGTQPPGSAQIFNNHIPIDPELYEAVSISKTTPMVNVNRGQLVPYTITVNSEVDFDLQNLTIADRFPPGFRYIADSARIDGVPAEPDVVGRELIWSDLGLTSNGRHTLQLLLAVGAGISEGEYVNRAQAIHSLTGNALSGEAAATVRLVPDPTFDCTDVMGKVFNDSNRNGVQDLDEPGIGGVRLVTATGLAATTDEYGRYHITCATVPREGRGSNFVVKLDDRTLPSGFRLSTPLVQIERATRGKALSFNFGASIHRVVGLDIADPVFEPDSTTLRPQWQPRINLLIEELQKGPATLRLSYLADVENPQLVDARVEAIRTQIETAWRALNCCYSLVVEDEIFWRRGAPPEQPRRTTGEGRE